MKDNRKILLGTKDVYPQQNKDLYINLEISSSSDELQTEIVNNNFNLREQFNKERRESLKFCLYGTLNSIYSDLENLELNINYLELFDKIFSSKSALLIHNKTIRINKNTN